jgi:hypothetical protein
LRPVLEFSAICRKGISIMARSRIPSVKLTVKRILWCNSRRRAKMAAGLAATGILLGFVAVPALGAAIRSTVPSISSITVTGYPKPAIPTFTIRGSGFGSAPTDGIVPSKLDNCGPGWAGSGLDYGRSNLWMLDTAQSVGLHGAWQDGADFTTTNGNCEGVVIQSWTATEIVFGLASTYETNSWGLTAGNTVCVSVKGVPGCLKLPHKSTVSTARRGRS